MLSYYCFKAIVLKPMYSYIMYKAIVYSYVLILRFDRVSQLLLFVNRYFICFDISFFYGYYI